MYYLLTFLLLYCHAACVNKRFPSRRLLKASTRMSDATHNRSLILIRNEQILSKCDLVLLWKLAPPLRQGELSIDTCCYMRRPSAERLLSCQRPAQVSTQTALQSAQFAVTRHSVLPFTWYDSLLRICVPI
jgi:hypothetical protein